MSTFAPYVAPGRCAHCGHKKITWSPARIVRAARVWYEEHGRAPRANDWRYATVEHPNYGTAQAVFGSWNRMVRAAKIDDESPRDFGSGRVWSKDEIAEAMLDHLLRVGRWPTARQWREPREDEHRPCTTTVTTVFGSWNAAKRYAGWNGSKPERSASTAKTRAPLVTVGG